MKLFLTALVATLIAPSAFAHLELGKYAGTLKNGESSCSFEVRSVSFVENRRHPLNERVELVVGDTRFVLSHQPKINVADGSVGFDKDNLSGALGTSYGGTAAVLAMSHTEGNEGPRSLTIAIHDYKRNLKETSVCTNLAHQK